ncbi:MAG: hypothetical protein IAF02_15325 [Anaerolineae bacterium]|nr:hypothetical protein [Anaerolineae bacterium]
MNIIVTLIVIVLQLFVGYAVGLGAAMALGVGNGLELLVIGVGNTLGVWGVGALAAKLRRSGISYVASLLGTAVCASLGIALILLTPATGFVQLLYPLVGAVIGYYLGGWLRR